MKKKLSIAAVCVSLLLPHATAFAQTSRFPDVPATAPYASAVEYLRKTGRISGYSDGTFRPNTTVNRAEFLVMTKPYTPVGSVRTDCFADVRGQWFAAAVCSAVADDMVRGFPDGTFKPEQSVTFAEAASIAVRSRGIHPPVDSVWYTPYVQQLQEWNAIPETIDTAHRPITRAEAATILYGSLTPSQASSRTSVSFAYLAPDTPVAEAAQPQPADRWYSDRLVFTYSQEQRAELRSAFSTNDKPARRSDLLYWDDVLTALVKRQFIPAPVTARIYGALALAQREVLVLGAEEQGASRAAVDLVSQHVLCHVLPDHCDDLSMNTKGSEYSMYLARLVSDKIIAHLEADPLTSSRKFYGPAGNQYWQGQDPVSPWVAGWDYLLAHPEESHTPPPPRYDSAEDLAEVETVRMALDHLTPEQLSASVKWNYPENPIQPFMGKTHVYLQNENASAERTAFVRAVLYSSIADGFTAAWKGKYTYWTARPSMRDERIEPIMPNPNFPSYPSGHATLAGAAGSALKRLYPEYTNDIESVMEQVRNARLWAGVHFEVDNHAGLELGQNVANSVWEWFEK